MHGNVLRQSSAVEQGHGRQMVRRAVAAGRIIELTGFRAHHLHQLRDAVHRQVVTDQQHQRGVRHQHNRREILDRVIGQVAFEGRHRAMGAGGEHNQRVAVGRRLLGGHDADDAGRAAAVVDHDRPAVLRADPLGDDPRDAVIRSAGRVGHDDANRFSRIWLGALSESS